MSAFYQQHTGAAALSYQNYVYLPSSIVDAEEVFAQLAVALGFDAATNQ